MARGNLTNDEIRWILTADASGAQEPVKELSSEIQRLAKENQELVACTKEANASLKENEKTLAKLEKQGRQNTGQYKALTKEINRTKSDIAVNTRTVDENRKAIDAQNKKLQEVVKTMKVEEMTMSQLRNRARELQNQLERTAKATSPESYAKLEKELNAVRGRMNQLRQSTIELNKEANKTTSFWQGSLMTFAGNLMTKALQSLKQLAAAAREFVAEGIRMAATAEGVANAFNKIDRPGLLKNLRRETNGLLNDFDLMKAAVRAENFQMPIEQLGTLLKFAQQRAAETGESVEELSNKIIDGVGKKSTKAFTALGISADRFKEKVKETGDFTTAAIQIVNEELEKQGIMVETSADKAQQASVKWQNAQMKVGQQLLGIRNIFNQLSGNIADWFSEMIGKHFPGMMKWLEDMTNALIDIYNSSEMIRIAVMAWANTFRVAGSSIIFVLKSIGDNLLLILNMFKSIITLDFQAGIDAWKNYGDNMVNNAKSFMGSMKEIVVDNVKSINKEVQKVDFTSMMPGGAGAGSGVGARSGTSGNASGGASAKSGSGSGSGSAARPGPKSDPGAALKDEMQRRLQIIENELEKEKNLRKKYLLDGEITEKEYNDRIEELTIAALQKKTEVKGQEEQAYIRYQSQILDIQLKQQETADKLLLQELVKTRDEKLKIIESTRNADLERLQDTESDQKIYALRAKEIEMNATAARETIVREFGTALEQAEFNNLQNRAKAVDDNARLILDAEEKTLKARADLIRQFSKTEADFDRLYNIRNWEQRRADELALLERYRRENLIDEETFLAAVEAVDKKYRDEKQKARHDASLESMREAYGAELENLQYLHDRKLLSEKEYEDAVFRLRMKYASQYAQKSVDLLRQSSATVADLMQAETLNIETRYDAEIAAAAGNAKEVERLEREKAQKKLDIEKKYADVQFAITAAQIIASTAMAVMQAFSQLGPVAGAIAGAIVAAAGIAQLVVANAQRKKVKSMTLAGAGSSDAPPAGKITMRDGFAEGGYNSGDAGPPSRNADYSTGGYTLPGAKYEQAGWLPVHGGEYVVASDEMARPDVAEQVRRIEEIRRMRTSRNVSGFAEGGHNDAGPNPIPPATGAGSAAGNEAIEKLSRLVQRLLDGDITVNYGITELEAGQRRKLEVESVFTRS